MTYDPNQIAIPRETQVFIKLETTAGTLVTPDALDAIIVAGAGDFNQKPSYTNSPEIQDTRDVLARAQDMAPPGTWSLPMVCRPSGTQGDPPLGDVLYECLQGTKDEQATYVDYTQATSKKTFSAWWKVSHTVFFLRGCTVSNARIAGTNKGFPIVEFSGEFAQMGWVGSNALSTNATSGAATIAVDNGKHYRAGGMIYNYTADDDNGGSGFVISSISNDTLYLASVITEDWTTDDEIKPWLPTATPHTSSAIESRTTVVEFDDVALNLKSVNLDIQDPYTYLTDEITTTGYPTTAAEGERAISGSMSVVFRASDLQRYYDGYEASDTDVKIEIIFGNTDGSRCTFTMNQGRIEVPEKRTADPVVELNLGIYALGSAGEDSLSIRFN